MSAQSERELSKIHNGLQLDGKSKTVGAEAVVIYLADTEGNILLASGTTKPTDSTAGYAKSALFIKTDATTGNKGLYENTGTKTACVFNLIGSVDAGEIADGSITVDKLASDAVETAKIKDNAVTQDKIADDAVGSDQIADDAVTTDKVADDAITADKIADNAVGQDQIADNAVGQDQIADDAVGADQLAGLSVGGAHLITGKGYFTVSVLTNSTTPVNVFGAGGVPTGLLVTDIKVTSLDTTAGNIAIKTDAGATLATIAKGEVAGVVTGAGAITNNAIATAGVLTVESSSAGEARVSITFTVA